MIAEYLIFHQEISLTTNLKLNKLVHKTLNCL